MNQSVVKQILQLTSPELTKEESEILEGAPQTKVLNSSSVVLALIKSRRQRKAQQLLRQLLES